MRENVYLCGEILHTMAIINFTKMHGIGNDYIYIDCRDSNPGDLSKLAIIGSDRHKGIGADGIVSIHRSDKADYRMRIFNADGSEAQMCGNGARCVGKYLYDRCLTDKLHITLETLGGIKTLDLHPAGDGTIGTVTVDMEAPSLYPKNIPVKTDKIEFVDQPVDVDGEQVRLTAVSVGNPHAVVIVDNVDTADVSGLGAKLEHHPLFPERTNVEFVQIISPDRIKMRVWERGSGETMACGTGSCASVIATATLGLTGRQVTVELLGGNLDINWDPSDNHIYMTGEATTVYNGVWEPKL